MPAEIHPQLQRTDECLYRRKENRTCPKGPALTIDEVVSPKDVTVEQIATLKLLAPFRNR